MTNLRLVDDAKSADQILSKTSVYPIIDVKLCATPKFDTVPDIATGGKRKRKYGLVVSMSGIPDLANQTEPIMFPPILDSVLIDGESLDEIRERAVLEIDMMIEKIKEAVTQIATQKRTNEATKQNKT